MPVSLAIQITGYELLAVGSEVWINFISHSAKFIISTQ